MEADKPYMDPYCKNRPWSFVFLTYVLYSINETGSPGRNVFGCQVIFMSESVPGASMTFHAFSL
jgi:hypothetical protein